VLTIDGVRAEYEDGFGLARASNTTPVIVLRFEGTTNEALTRIQEEFRKALQPLKPEVPLPF
jgi:phosphomannomutase/phosphoglucomutase